LDNRLCQPQNPSSILDFVDCSVGNTVLDLLFVIKPEFSAKDFEAKQSKIIKAI